MKYVLGALAALAIACQSAAAQSANPLGSLFEPMDPRRFNAPPLPWRLRAEENRAPASPTYTAPTYTASRAGDNAVEQAPLPPVAQGGYGSAQQAPQQITPGAYSGSPGAQYGAQAYQQPALRTPPPAYAPAPPRAQPPRSTGFGLFNWFGGGARDTTPATPALQQAALQPAGNEEYLHRKIVASEFSYEPGTVIIDTGNRFLYLQMEGGQALRYGVGVGRQGFEWTGTATIGRKSEWPDWIPPTEMREREPWLPERVEGGLENPLGARALYLFEGAKDTLYRIHGTNQPETIGMALSSGCIRMLNDDVMDLYQRVPEGTKVVVM